MVEPPKGSLSVESLTCLVGRYFKAWYRFLWSWKAHRIRGTESYIIYVRNSATSKSLKIAYIIDEISPGGSIFQAWYHFLWLRFPEEQPWAWSPKNSIYNLCSSSSSCSPFNLSRSVEIERPDTASYEIYFRMRKHARLLRTFRCSTTAF